jgi:Ca-activated chloride channel family protein
VFPQPRFSQAITAGGAGYVTGFETEELGRIVIGLGGGRNVAADEVDPAVGILIEKKRDDHIYLSVLGFGHGNYQDSKMEQLADNGNGNYAYIDNLLEAKKYWSKRLVERYLP